jgi:hypothetical protein
MPLDTNHLERATAPHSDGTSQLAILLARTRNCARWDYLEIDQCL